jgi:hypothetical protein
MGYESRIYVAEKYNTPSWNDDGTVYADVIAEVDLSKCYPLSDILRYKPATNCYFYTPGSADPVREDCYGKPLTECTVHEAIAIIEKVMETCDYWRLNVLLATLREIDRFINNCDNFVVLHYGY